MQYSAAYPLPLSHPRRGGRLRGESVSMEPELEPESEPAPSSAIDAAVAQLGAEWSRRSGGSPAPAPMAAWLARDLEDTLIGAKRRPGTRKYPPDVIGRAWLISRHQLMRFKTEWPAGLKTLRNFAPPAQPVTLVSSPSIGDSNEAKVAPVLVRFVKELKLRYSGFDVWNYPGHGGGNFHNRGFSLDFGIKGRDSRGFYPRHEAIRFLRAVHRTAHQLGAEWRVLYNDFSVADAVNRETGAAHVLYMGKVRRGANNAVAGLNWHGPHPLILHFHLDLAPARRVIGTPVRSSSPAPSRPPAEPRPPHPIRPVGSKPSTPPSRFRRKPKGDVEYAREIANSAVPGVPGTTLHRLIEQWRPRICPEVPLSVLLAFMRYESGGKYGDATHGTAKNRWTSPAFYELGLFQTPAGLHGVCTSGDWNSCQFAPPGKETSRPSTWKRLCARISADPNDWKNPTTQVRVGLMDLEEGAKSLRTDFPELFPKPGSDWDVRMAVLYRFARGGGYARSFLRPYRTPLAAMPEKQRWAFLRDKVVTVKGKKGAIRRLFYPENVDKKMALAAKLGYVPVHA